MLEIVTLSYAGEQHELTNVVHLTGFSLFGPKLFTPNLDTPASIKTWGCQNTLFSLTSLGKHEHVLIITFSKLLQHLIFIPSQ